MFVLWLDLQRKIAPVDLFEYYVGCMAWWATNANSVTFSNRKQSFFHKLLLKGNFLGLFNFSFRCIVKPMFLPNFKCLGPLEVGTFDDRSTVSEWIGELVSKCTKNWILISNILWTWLIGIVKLWNCSVLFFRRVLSISDAYRLFQNQITISTALYWNLLI